MVTSKISWIFFICQVGYMLQAVSAEEGCTVVELLDDDDVMLPPGYYAQNEKDMYCWAIKLPQNSNANDFIRISSTSLRGTVNGRCHDTIYITEICGNMSKIILKEMCSCQNNCDPPISRNASLECYLKVHLTKNNNGRLMNFQVKFSHESDSLVSNTPSSTTNAPKFSNSTSHDTRSLVPNTTSSTTYTDTVSKSTSHDTNSLVPDTTSTTMNAPNFSKTLKGKQTGPGAKVLVPVLVILIMILVVALSVAYFIRYYRRRKSDDKVTSNTTFNNAAYSQNDVITSESNVESQLNDRNVRTDTVNETPEISHSERLQGDNVEYNPLYIAGNEPNKEGQVDNIAYQSVDDANQNPHEYTYIDLKGKQEEGKNANQGQTSHVTNVTDGNDSSNPVEHPDESKYYSIEPRIH